MVETPANPTNSLVDLELMREVSEKIGERQSGRASAGGGRQHLSRAGLSASARASAPTS